jgi:ADP-ribose pyrophosphatase YjhB (NUDIX family)
MYIISILATPLAVWAIVARFAPHISVLYAYCVLPAIWAASVTTLYHLRHSKYLRRAKLLADRVLGSAGLGWVLSDTGRVLLNKQSEPPWLHKWCLPGGYCNLVKDGNANNTVHRRVIELAKPTCAIHVGSRLAVTKNTPAYRRLIDDYDLLAVADEVFEVLKTSAGSSGSCRLSEADVKETNLVRWYTVAEIKNGSVDMPPHVREIASYFGSAEGCADETAFWRIDIQPRQHTGRNRD